MGVRKRLPRVGRLALQLKAGGVRHIEGEGQDVPSQEAQGPEACGPAVRGTGWRLEAGR